MQTEQTEDGGKNTVDDAEAAAARVVMSMVRSMPPCVVARLVGLKMEDMPPGAPGEETNVEEREHYLRWVSHELVDGVAGLWDAVCDLVRLETDSSNIVKSQPNKALLPGEEEAEAWSLLCACGAPNALLRASEEREAHDVHLRKFHQWAEQRGLLLHESDEEEDEDEAVPENALTCASSTAVVSWTACAHTLPPALAAHDAFMDECNAGLTRATLSSMVHDLAENMEEDEVGEEDKVAPPLLLMPPPPASCSSNHHQALLQEAAEWVRASCSGAFPFVFEAVDWLVEEDLVELSSAGAAALARARRLNAVFETMDLGRGGGGGGWSFERALLDGLAAVGSKVREKWLASLRLRGRVGVACLRRHYPDDTAALLLAATTAAGPAWARHEVWTGHEEERDIMGEEDELARAAVTAMRASAHEASMGRRFPLAIVADGQTLGLNMGFAVRTRADALECLSEYMLTRKDDAEVLWRLQASMPTIAALLPQATEAGGVVRLRRLADLASSVNVRLATRSEQAAAVGAVWAVHVV